MDKRKKLLSLIADYYRKEGRPLPWRESADPYRVWLSEIMLQQTRATAVIPYFHRFLDTLPNVKALAEAEEETVLKLWEGLGYYSRARNLHRAAQAVMEKHGGVFPDTYEELLALPGVGEYTAAAIGSICFGLPCAAVDGNVLRIFSRVFADARDITEASTKKDVAQKLSAVFPRGAEAAEVTQGMMEIGQCVCLPNGAPLCDACPLAAICTAKAEGKVSLFPVRAPKAPRRREDKTVLILHVADETPSGRFLLHKRADEGLLNHLWEFPNFEGTLSLDEAIKKAELIGGAPLAAVPTESAKHIFTHLEWHMTGVLIECKSFAVHDGFAAATADEIQTLYPIASAFRAFKKIALNGQP